MSLTLDTLWWAPHAKLHHTLSCSSLPPADSVRKALDSHFDWLVHHVTNFKPPSSESNGKITNSKILAMVNGKELRVETNLKNATFQLSKLLCIDEIQAHILLKRWRKDTMEKQGFPPRDKDGQFILSTEAVLEVVEEYYRERLALLKVVSAVLLLGEKTPAAAMYHKLVRRLINSGLEDNTHKALKANLEGSAISRSGSLASATLSLALLPTAGLAALPPVLYERWRRQVEVERAQLVMVLLQLYATHEVPCSADRLHSLLQLLREHLFPSRPGGADVDMVDGGATGGGAPPTLEQSLACLLVLAAMGLERVLRAVDGGTRPTPTTIPILPRLNDLVDEVTHWAAVPAAAAVFLTFSAVLQLLGQMGVPGEANAVAELHRKAVEAGELASLELLVQGEALRGGSAEGIVLRGVVATCLSVINTAFSMSPVNLGEGRWRSAVGTMCNVYGDCPPLCEYFWDDDHKLDMPLMALLDEAATMFPADFSPLVRLLSSLSSGPPAAKAAGQYLSQLAEMACWHDINDPAIDISGPEAYLLQPMQWSQAPAVSSVCLPEGTYGRVLPLPESCREELEGRQVLISWHVECADGVGQLLLMARAAQCTMALEAAALDPSVLDTESIQDLADILALIHKLACTAPDQIPALLRVDITVQQGRPSVDLLTLVTRLASALVASAAHPALQPFPLQLLADCLHVMRAVSELQPLRVAEALASVPLFSAAPLMEVRMVSLADLPNFNPRMEDSSELQGLRALQTQAEGPAGQHPVTLAFLELVAALLDRGYSGGPMWAWVGHALHVVLPGHPQWAYKEASGRWQVGAAALRVVRLAVAAGQWAVDPAVVPAVEEMEREEGQVGVVVGRALKITEVAAGVLWDLCMHGESLLAPTVPPPAAALQQLQEQTGGIQEVDAVEACLLQALHLLPVALAAAAHFSEEVPLLHFLNQPTPHRLSPTQTLATYLHHPFSPDPETGHLLTLRALAAIVRTSTPHSQATPLDQPPALLPAREQGGAPLLRHLLSYYTADFAQANPEVAAAALELLEAACVYPLLLHTLLLPSALESASASPASTATATIPAVAMAPTATPPAPSTSAAAAAPASTASRKKSPASALDGLWALLQRSKQLWEQQPVLLCSVLRVLLALWQRPAAACRPIHLLRQQPQFFAHLTSFFPEPTTPTRPTTTSASPAAGTPPSPTPQEAEKTPWQIQAESYALDIIMLEAFVHPRAATPSASVWTTLDTWGPDRLAHLLRRYQAVAPPPAPLAALLARLQALQLQLLSTAVVDTWPLTDPDPLTTDRLAIAPELRKDAADLIQMVALGATTLDDLQDAYEHLTTPPDASPRSSPPYSPDHPNPAARLLAAKPLGRALLCRTRAVPICTAVLQYGPDYVVDAAKLERLLGPSVVLDVPAVLPLLRAARTAGLAASAADARLHALRSLAALLLLLPQDPKRRAALQQCGPLLAAACHACNDAAGSLVASTTHPDYALLRLPWGLPSLQGNWMEAAQHLSGICLQASRMWRDGPGAVTAAPAALPASPSANRGSPLGFGAGSSRSPSPPPAGEPAWAKVVGQVAEPLEAWLGRARGLANGTTISVERTAPVAESLMAALLSVLPPTTPSSAPPAAAPSSTLLTLLPHLCALCSQPPPSSTAALQLLTRIVQAHLPASDWLPVAQHHLSLAPHIISATRHITHLTSHPSTHPKSPHHPHHTSVDQSIPDMAGPHQAGAAASSMAVLQLALAMAQTPQGAAYLHHSGITDLLITFAGHLLSPKGGALGCLPELDVPQGNSAVQVREASEEGDVDLGGAYLLQGAGVASPLHQQWLTSLSLLTAIATTLSFSSEVQSLTLDFIAATELRLLLTCHPPAADISQPLTLALIAELQRTLFLLLLSARNPGLWHLHLPGSILSFRTALSTFLSFVALPSTTRAPLVCPPRTPYERALAARPTRVPATAGWFRACTVGSLLFTPSDPNNSNPSTAGAGTDGDVGTAVPEYCTEYSVRLAEGIYQCGLYALMFLQATSPKVAEGEGASLGPAWPSRGVLVALEEGGQNLIDALVDGATREEPRRAKLAHLVAQVVQASTQFLQVMGYPPSANRQRNIMLRRAATLNRSSSINSSSLS